MGGDDVDPEFLQVRETKHWAAGVLVVDAGFCLSGFVESGNHLIGL